MNEQWGMDADQRAWLLFYGWLNSNRAYLTELHPGPGRMLITTFRFGG
jgi:hypothetical protein